MAKGKPGRNDPCPCGSGLKFKKCHLRGFEIWNRIAAAPLLDAVEAKIDLVLGMEGPRLLRGIEEQSVALQRECFGSLPNGTELEPDDAVRYLRTWLDRIELELGSIASSDSRYFWLFLLHRLRPTTRRFRVTQHTVKLYRKVLKLAVLKYGQASGTTFTNLPANFDQSEIGRWVFSFDDARLPEMEVEADTSAVPVSVSADDIFKVMLMEQLAHDFCGGTALLRRVWKGGRLPVEDGLPRNVLHDSDTDFLIELYDQRLPFASVLSEFGSSISPEIALEADGKFTCLIPVFNLEEVNVPLVWGTARDDDDDFARKFRGIEYRSNYIVVPATLDRFLEKAKQFGDALEDAHGFSPQDLVCFLIALTAREFTSWFNNPRKHLQLFQRGYVVAVDEETFIEDVALFYADASVRFGRALSEAEAQERVATIVQSLRYEDGFSEHIDLWDRSGTKMILEMDRTVMIDFHAIPDVLGDFFKPLARMSGAVGNLKGEDFEREVALLLENTPKADVIWKGKVIADATREQGEVDLGVIKDGTLFILECKAHALHHAFDRGEPDALAKRQDLIREALNQVDSLARFLAGNPKGTDYEIPGSVSHIVSAAVSSYPEYIDERSERFFLSEDVPRVCTPEEIEGYIAKFKTSEHGSETWFLEVQRTPAE